jgi:hypothetical protein
MRDASSASRRQRVFCRILGIVLVLGSAVWSFGAQSVKPNELAQLKRDSAILERILGEVLRQNFENPFALTAEPQAAYLNDYGVTLSFHLKINRGTIRFFYGEIRNPRVQSPRDKRQQIEKVRELMIETLADYGVTIKQLDPAQRLSLCGHIEDRNELDASKKVTVLVVSASKEDIDLYASRKISLDAFRERLQVTEY